MAITFNSNKLDGKQRTIWRGEAKMLPGGFKLLQTFPAGTVLERGLPVYVDMSNLSGAIVKVSKVITGGTTSKPMSQVTKCRKWEVKLPLQSAASTPPTQTMTC